MLARVHFCMLLAYMGQLQDVFSVYCFRILSQCSVFLFHRIQFRLESHKLNFFNSRRRNTASLIPIPSLLISLSFSLPLFPRAECLCYVNVFHHSSDLPGLSEHVIAFLSLPLALSLICLSRPPLLSPADIMLVVWQVSWKGIAQEPQLQLVFRRGLWHEVQKHERIIKQSRRETTKAFPLQAAFITCQERISLPCCFW